MSQAVETECEQEPIDKLYNFSESEYGENYKAHLMEQYKLYLEMIDRISSRRQSVNSFFLSINTALIALLGYKNVIDSNNSKPQMPQIFIALCGIILCFTWYRLIISYKGLNSGKFKVLHKIEEQLPISPYDIEWEVMGRGKDPSLYLPFTNIEKGIPWVFLFIHLVYLIHTIFPSSIIVYVVP